MNDSTAPETNKIRHTPSTLGQPQRPAPAQRPPGSAPRPPAAPASASTVPPIEIDDPDLAPVQVAAPTGDPDRKVIRAFDAGKKRHEDQWARTPNATGTGAIHVKTFHGKLTDDALVYMDQQINEWLDAHPQYEVKFVTSTIGEYSGKTREPQLVCQVWV
jgi:hypothetical protein